MAVKLVEWQLPYTAGGGIEITANKVIQLLLREDDNLIKINDDREAYVDLQLASWITPSSDFPAWVTVWQVLSSDWWLTSGTLLNFQTISWDYWRWLYGTDWHMYYDHWTWVFTQIYSKPEVDALFTQLRSELATVAFTWDYNDLINRPNIPVIWDWTLTINQNNISKWTFTANQIGNTTVDLTDTTYPEMTVWDIGTGTSTTPSVASPKTISDYVKSKIANAYIYKGSVTTYADLPSTGLTAWDVYNVDREHTTAPVFPAWSNLAWTGTEWDVLWWLIDLNLYQKKLTAWANIQIDQNTDTISATDTTYSAWANITIDANNQISAVDTTYSTATSNVEWLVKIASDTVQSVAPNAVSSTADRTYGVQLNSSNQMVVNVPWTDTTTSSATSSVAGTIKLASDTTQTEGAQAVSSTANRTYWLQTNASWQWVVNVPWTDTQPNNTQISFTQAWVAKGDITLNQASAETIALEGGVLCTQSTYDGLPSSKTSDWNFYIIYSS